MSQDWKKRLGVVYSTNDDFVYENEEIQEDELLPPEKQVLYIELDRKQRKGKQVSIISGFVGPNSDLEDLAKKLKQHCATGGSVKDGEIYIQGDMREKIIAYLNKNNYKTKRKGS